jgi:hypothetical protein
VTEMEVLRVKCVSTGALQISPPVRSSIGNEPMRRGPATAAQFASSRQQSLVWRDGIFEMGANK